MVVWGDFIDYIKRCRVWLENSNLSTQEKEELLSLNEAEKEERFWTNLTFGTAGLRGISRLGLNGMNRYTVAHATAALAQLLLSESPTPTAVVCYDCRNGSRALAMETACVLAEKGISVRFFSELRPTPQLSFAIRYFHAQGGVNITASHNSKEYNGYKAYGAEGAQLSAAQVAQVSEIMEKTEILSAVPKESFTYYQEIGKITLLDERLDDIFIERVLGNCPDIGQIQKATAFTVVYTPLHGTGAVIVPKMLARAGLKNLLLEPEQMRIDGSFTTVKSPNPENRESFALAEKLGKTHQADLILATDPDCDRMGAVVRDKLGNYLFLTGNQIGIILLEYLLQTRKRLGNMPKKPAFVTSIVTSRLPRLMCLANNIAYYETFTGFRFMANVVEQLAGEYLLAFEESFGYMVGGHVRDKDGAAAVALLCECGAACYNQGLTIADYLAQIYQKYGFSLEETQTIAMEGKHGAACIARIMAALRNAPPALWGGVALRYLTDYQTGLRKDFEKKYVDTIALQGSNVLQFTLSDGTIIVIRPSGTEPKIKIYLLLLGEDSAILQQKSMVYHQEIRKIIKIYGE